MQNYRAWGDQKENKVLQGEVVLASVDVSRFLTVLPADASRQKMCDSHLDI